MIESLMGRKLGMTQIFDETGQAVPVTVLKVGPCVVTQVRTQERDGYEAIQLGFEESKRLNSPDRGHQKAAGSSMRHLREVKASDISGYEIGQVVDCSLFTAGGKVDVTATSKGKGFAGVVKRHGFAGGPKTHGQSDRHRAPGSIGSSATPGRVFKGMRMAGRMGNERTTVQNLTIERVDAEKNLLLVRGSVPGSNQSLVIVRSAVKSPQTSS
ncbi:MAG: 50S ribosomal protein L3 [Chloroflexia bacterium]|jgi:large subunit ribosomal protein L3|nr:50S ribosomal protein L3 [Chloroflexia bacterium]